MARPVTDDGATIRLGPAPVANQSTGGRVLAENPLFPGALDLTIYRGDSYEWQIILLDPQGNRVDVTGWGFHAEVRDRVDGRLVAGFLVKQAVTTGGDNPDVPAGTPILGTVWMRLPSDQSRMVPDQAVWDLQVVDDTGWVRTLLRGTITVTYDVTTGLIDYTAAP